MNVATAVPGSETERPQARRQAILDSARVEAGRMGRHPAFLIGLAASVAQITLRPGSEDWAGQSHYLSSVAWTFTWIGALIAAALAAGRQRFASDPDLFPATPATPADRALGTALGLLGPALVTALTVAFVAGMNARAGGFILGDEGYSRAMRPNLFHWAQPVLLVVLAGVVGIALAQLPRGRLPALMVAVMAVFFGGTVIWAFQVHPIRVLHPFMFPTYEQRLPDSFSPAGWGAGDPPLNPPDEYTSFWRAVRFDTSALGWHLVYVGGLILLGVWVATRIADRGEHGSRTRWLVLAGLPLVLIAGVAQVVTAGMNG
ncbi:MAG: hypothetical protein M3450_01540 [Actinomycetota bacterium]|nr:hypothetical protein [Actinomycetota bacterium]MDQ3640166.1 hypothetical protein [Actinomycetota bacterium]